MSVLQRAKAGERIGEAEAHRLAESSDLEVLTETARSFRDEEHDGVVSYSPKVFLPLTHLCRDVCHYCTFAQPPRKQGRGFLRIEEMIATARAGVRAGCHEALFTLGDKPELRYASAAKELESLGHATTLSYLAEAAEAVYRETGLFPHLNPGVMTREEMARLKTVSISLGMMLESVSQRLCEKGGPHYGSPDKHPSVRLKVLEEAGELAIPFTTGILIGIGETRLERIQSLLAIREIHERHGHIQEVIVQNFRPKPGTRMASAPAPSNDDLVWTVAVARIVLGASMSIQVPPNLSPTHLRELLDAGINDWGGISPITSDFVNPEAPWPQLEQLTAATRAAGHSLTPRLALYPSFIGEPQRWADTRFHTALRRCTDASGYLREGDWFAGRAENKRMELPLAIPRIASAEITGILKDAGCGKRLSEAAIVKLFEARGAEFSAICAAADDLRSEVNGDVATFVVNRNINYTNVCSYRCGFCAFSKGKTSEALRGKPYDLDLAEIARRTREAWERGATEVCLQGGIHPRYTGETYLRICRAVKEAAPGIHVHAFSSLEIHQGARTLGISEREFLQALKAEGLNSLPGTAAEILDDEIRGLICPDKLNTREWIRIIETAHEVGLPTTSTIMFGHVDRPVHWARHLLALRDLQTRTGGITELVPLPFVHMEAPMYLKGLARRGPTFRETVLMHAVGRLVLHTKISNIQVSWVKLGIEGARSCLSAGANDLGGTLMNESISRAAGAAFGQELSPAAMRGLLTELGRIPKQRTTLYGNASAERAAMALAAAPLSAVNLPVSGLARLEHHSAPVG